ncbi:MAG: hypothetical protein ACI9JZ_002864, partial [Lentimonas sp.]
GDDDSSDFGDRHRTEDGVEGEDHNQ